MCPHRSSPSIPRYISKITRIWVVLLEKKDATVYIACDPMKSNPRFKVVVPSYNSFPWIEKTLESIQNQTYRNFDVCVIDDASTHPKQREVIERYCKKNGWLGVYNEKNQKALYNIVHGIKRLECNDDDVIMVVDGDDWLFSKWVFEDLDAIYSEGNVLITCGQPLAYRVGTIPAGAPKPPKDVIKHRAYRKWWWFPFSHLRTFKHVLWRNIRDEDLRDANGNYYTVTWDMAMMFPMAEMAGEDRIRYIDKVQYIYNDTNPINDFRIYNEDQKVVENKIRSMPQYDLLSL